MKRREFIAAAGTAAAGWPLIARGQLPTQPSSTVRQDWLDRRTEPILEPGLPIVDPHHHLWIRPGSRYLVDELLADINSGHNIVATVYVQARSMYREGGPVELRPVGETEYVNGVAAMFDSGVLGRTRACAGIVGQADLRLGGRVEPVLIAHLRAGGDRFRGIRHITSWDADASINNPDYPSPSGLLGDKTFREGFAVLGRFGLSFDAQLYHPQIDELASLAGSFPDTKIVLNHVGVPLGIGAYRNKRDEVFSRWAASTRALAAAPECPCQDRRPWHALQRFRVQRSSRTAVVGERGGYMPSLCRDVHRRLRGSALDVREQLPGRQSVLQLSGVLECLQANDERSKRH